MRVVVVVVVVVEIVEVVEVAVVEGWEIPTTARLPGPFYTPPLKQELDKNDDGGPSKLKTHPLPMIHMISHRCFTSYPGRRPRAPDRWGRRTNQKSSLFRAEPQAAAYSPLPRRRKDFRGGAASADALEPAACAPIAMDGGTGTGTAPRVRCRSSRRARRQTRLHFVFQVDGHVIQPHLELIGSEID